MVENIIPKNWKIKKLGDVLKVSSGKGLKINLLQGGDFPVYGGNGINGYHTEYLNESPKLIIGRVGAKCGVTCITKPKSWVTDNALIVDPIIPDFDIKFFQLKLEYENLNKLSVSTAQPVISGSKIYEYEILLPPLSEQQAIVYKIEELLSDLENGKQQLQIAQQQLKIYRQSLLKWAFEGRLTNKDVKDGELPKGWKSTKLGFVCHKIQDGSHFSPQVQYDEPGENRYMYITAKNIRNDYMDFRKLSYVDKDFHDSIYSRCNPEFGDVLLTKDGVNTGEATLNTLHEPFSLLSSVCIFKPKKYDLESRFLKYYIQSPLGSKLISDSMTGTAIKRIILRKIKDALIIIPPFLEQQLIVDELESKLTVCDKIEETISQSLLQAESLRQSILKKAFEGKLI